MATTVTVTQVGQGVEGSRRFTDVVLGLSGAIDATQETNGIAVDIKKLPFDEVTDVHVLQSATGQIGGVSVELAGTKSAPTLKFGVTDVTDGSLTALVDTDVPPTSIALRLFGA